MQAGGSRSGRVPDARPPEGGAVSDYNLWHEQVLAQRGLTVYELRLALALSREILGWNGREGLVGRELLMGTAGIRDVRSFQKARDGLAERGLIEYVPPDTNGRNARGAVAAPH